MKKIAILTWLHNGNYGSILQAYALQKYLRNEGYAVNNIDLNPSIFEKVKNCIQQGNPLISLLKEKLNAAKSKNSFIRIQQRQWICERKPYIKL